MSIHIAEWKQQINEKWCSLTLLLKAWQILNMLGNWLIKWGRGFYHMGWCNVKCYLICHCHYHSRNWPLEGDRVLSNHCDFSSSCLPEASSTSLQVLLCFGQQSICLVVSLNKESFEKGLTSDWSQLFWSMKVKAPLFFQYENSPYTSLRNSGWWKLKRKWMRILPRRDGGPKGAALLGVHLEVFSLPSMYQIKVRPLLSNGWLTPTSTGCLKKTEFYRIEHLQICHFPPLSFRDLCWAARF